MERISIPPMAMPKTSPARAPPAKGEDWPVHRQLQLRQGQTFAKKGLSFLSFLREDFIMHAFLSFDEHEIEAQIWFSWLQWTTCTSVRIRGCTRKRESQKDSISILQVRLTSIFWTIHWAGAFRCASWQVQV